MLSIIVPIYNTEEYLKECIESILNQTYPDIELILVDDGSDDNSVYVCNEYTSKDSRVKLIKKSHEGTFSARRAGVLHATGKYVTFVDSDDFVKKESYQIAIEDMSSDMDIIMFGIIRYHKAYQTIDNVSYQTGVYERTTIESEIYPSMIWDDKRHIYGLDPSLCSKIFKKELLDRFYTQNTEMESHYGEDHAVIFPLILEANKISIHNEAYYFHRQREKGTLPPYITDNNFLLKLHGLYVHLLKYFGNIPMFRKQVDLLYAHCVKYNGLKYGISMYIPNDVFPFDKVEKGEKVIIYGAGNIGQLYMQQLSKLNYCSVVLWVDKNKWKDNDRISRPENIVNTAYDKIVISIANADIRASIKKYLLNLGVPVEKIV